MARPANEILDDLEQEWAPRLRAVSLAAELQLDAKRVRLAARCLGMMYQSRLHDPYQRQVRLKRYPASMVVALSGVGALEYSSGTYWSAVWDATGVRGDANTAQEWGDVYLRALREFRCPGFADLPLKYVGPILLHAGIPRYSLAELIDIALRRADIEPALDGAQFVQWAAAPGRGSRIQSLDKPAQRFLTDAGEFAVDWLDRLLDLLDRLREPAPDLDGVRLPEWVVEHVRQLLADKPPRLARRRGAGQRSTEAPRLALDPYGLGVHLVLPPVGEQPDGVAIWQVSLDGVTTVVRTRASWPGASESAPGTTLSLPRPVRTASVSLGHAGLSADVDVVDPGDPLLVFDDGGRRLPAALPLPPEPVWVLYPEAEGGLEVKGAATSLGVAPTPYGWDGWRLERLDLSTVPRLRVSGGSWRAVRGSSRARLEMGRPVVGVTTAYGTAVHAEPPMLLLPSTDGASVSWSVTVRRPGETALLTRDVEIASERAVDVFKDVPRPLVGPYQVVVRGPLGRGLSREIELVEGLRVRSDPPWREFVAAGLTPSRVAVSIADGIRAEPREITLGPQQNGFHLDVDGSGCTEVLQVVVPHMAVQVTREGAAGSWSARPVALESEQLRDLDWMAIRLPEQVPQGRVVLVRGQEIQATPLAEGTGNVARLDVRRFADTVGETGSGRLELELLGRRIPLASIRPRHLAAGASVAGDGRVELIECSDADGLVAGIYRVFKPWREPMEKPVQDSRTEPDVRVTGSGPLLIRLRVEDPWVPAPWPVWPGRDNTHRVDVPLRSLSDSWEDRAASWLAGQGAAPGGADALAAMLFSYGLTDELREAGCPVDVRSDVAAVFAEAPLVDIAAAIRASRAGSAEIAAVLVHSGAVLRPAPTSPVDESVWSRSALAGMLAASGGLRAGDVAALEAVTHAAGPLARALIEGGNDPHAAVGRFGPDALQFAALPRAVLDNVWRAARIVPAYLLDADSRVTAARQLFDARERPGVRRVASLAKHLAERLAATAEEHVPGIGPAVVARQSAYGWQSLPALSMALALCARASAHGAGAAGVVVSEHLATWATLARHAPDLVQIDLVLAECLVLGAER